MAVRSKVLGSGTMTTSAVTAYTCPSGKTAIIKQLSYFNPAGGATTAVFFAHVIGGNSRGFLRRPGVVVSDGDAPTVLYWVLEPGQTVTVQANPSSAVQYVLYGVELDGVAP
jgi:hypothetical protein